jgi:SagB-type dehydrogenase family enzyme
MAQEFGRGTASGGGLYPAQIYLVTGSNQSLKPGVYQYGSGQHVLYQIRCGDLLSPLSQNLIQPDERSPLFSQYLVIAIDFWSNCFKYNNFGYHVCTQDVGATLASLQMICRAMAIPIRTFLNFHDRAVNELIGADGNTESAFAVIGLGDAVPLPLNNLRKERSEPIPQTPRPWQRSRYVKIPDDFLNIHRQLLIGDRSSLFRPEVSEDSERTKKEIESYVTDYKKDGPIDVDLKRRLPSILLARRSAWSSMSSRHPIGADKMLKLLDFISRFEAVHEMHDVLPTGSLSLYLRVNKVDDMSPGGYLWHDQEKSAIPVSTEHVSFWQSTYSMDNYNIDETSCIVFVVGNLPEVVALYGPRGYRILNAYVGRLAQRAYVGAAALELDCGVVLGVKAQEVKRIYRLPSQHNVFLAIYLCPKQRRVEMFDFRLISEVPRGAYESI